MNHHTRGSDSMDIKARCRDILGKCITGIMDCLATCVGSMAFVAGRRVMKVFITSLAILAFSVGCWIVGVWTVVSWQEAAVCSLFSGVLTLLDESSRARINRMVKEVRRHGGTRE